MTKQQLLEEARKLPPDERADLAAELWAIVEESGELSPEMKAELDRRIAEDDAYDAPGEPVEVWRARLLRGEI